MLKFVTFKLLSLFALQFDFLHHVHIILNRVYIYIYIYKIEHAIGAPRWELSACADDSFKIPPVAHDPCWAMHRLSLRWLKDPHRRAKHGVVFDDCELSDRVLPQSWSTEHINLMTAGCFYGALLVHPR